MLRHGKVLQSRLWEDEQEVRLQAGMARNKHRLERAE